MPQKRASNRYLPVRFSLDGEWTLSGADPEGEVVEVPARVPGVVHMDLERAGVIPDAFEADNEEKVQWVALQNWTYKRTFEVDKPLLGKKHVELVCEGLDTVAAVRINGEDVGRADNMFIPWRFDAKPFLRAGENEITVCLRSPVEEGLRLHDKHKSVRLYEGDANPRAYLRKAQYSYGWDWGPKLTTSGIWRSIYLEAWDAARIENVYWRTVRADDDSARVKVTIEASGAARTGARARLSIGSATFEVALEKKDVKDGLAFTGAVDVDTPSLWWPNGSGPQNLYKAEVELVSAAMVLDRREEEIGLRTVDIKREKDDEGETFIIMVNGRELFSKGANWIPADSYLPRITADDYDDWVRIAAEAGMNMLRVWGGGIYEDEAFYRACDRRGIMVWQDFMFACAMYPEEKWFLRNVEREAESVVRILRNHPSIVLWCGNNENHWAARSWWPQDPFGGETIYDKMLPKITERLDPSRPYWPGSPYGGKDPNSMAEGDRHSWDVWSGWRDYSLYLSDKGRFVSEFGFQGCPEMETVAHFGPLDELKPQHPLFERHNKMVEGTERLFRFLAGTFPVTTDLEEFVYLTQVLQAEAIKTGVLHWRSRMMKTAGALYWQINDCWPVISWASVDYRKRPKGLYWYTKRFFAPVAARVAILPDGVSAWIVNDTQRKLEGEFVIQSMTVDGQETAAVREHVEVAPNSAYRTGPFKPDLLRIDDPSRQMVVATFEASDGKSVRDVALAVRPKHMRIGDPGLDWIAAGEHGTFTLTVSAKTLAYAVYLRLPGTEAVFSDNFFTLLPGESIDVVVSGSGLSASVASKKLSTRWLKGGL